MSMIGTRHVLAGCSLGLLAGCGGGLAAGGGIAQTPPPVATPAPTPTPTPTPAPTPPAFQPVAATLFADQLYNAQLKTVGKGWGTPDADNFSVSYDAASKTYQVTAPIKGSGTLMQVGRLGYFQSPLPGQVFSAALSTQSQFADFATISPAGQSGSVYSYVSFVDLYTYDASAGIYVNGVFAVGQPTLAGQVPLSGIARYVGHAVGRFPVADGVYGTSRFDFNFGTGALSGEISLQLFCDWGCSYPDVATYALTNTKFSPGATGFSGNLSTPGAPSEGSFSGIFAGPGAVETMGQFQVPFLHPERKSWITAGGAFAGSRQ
ncbi:HupA family protein [Sandarakinorhabdus rubra]|uniref:hypothetical protein n=1 Tax=Sandarakinorhabdus rubra TaxID=2672568 RepID=UPI001969CF35|nr:hypothetical protein [Sandarakinorhabdus rubra]